MTRPIAPLTEPMDAGLNRVERRIVGRAMAHQVAELLGDDVRDPHFMGALLETLKACLPAEPEAPAPPPVPIARLGAVRMPFGQHMGRTLDEVPRPYLDWLCANQEDFYRDLRDYLRHPELESRRRGIEP